MTEIDEFLKLVPTPGEAADRPTDAEWRATESKFGALPNDYKNFVSRYGSGRIDGFLFIFNPSAKNKFLNLIYQVDLQLEVLRDISVTESLPYGFFPDPGGLLPVGATENGDMLYWLTEGAPDSWKIVVNSARSPDWEVFSCGLMRFVVGVLSKSIRCNSFPDDFPDERHCFLTSNTG